jgi:hypothetical protein
MKVRERISSIRKHYYFPAYSPWIFILFLLILSAVYNYQGILVKPPQSLHRWRQCDCLSITLNYYQDHNAFLEPSMHNLGRDGTGKTVSEFPILYFSVAQLWKVFGYHEFIYRLLVLLFFLSGLFALFRIFEKTLEDSVLAILGTLLLFTSPTLVYYANNFLMDIPALSLAMMGFCLFLRFCQSSSNRHLYLSAGLYALAGLLKISSLLSFMAIAGIFILEWSGVRIIPARKIFRHPVKQFAVLAGVVLIQVIWYAYAGSYNARHNAGVFLIGTLPVWNLSWAQIRIVLDAVVQHMKSDYFRLETQVVFLFMFGTVLVFYRKLSRNLLLSMIIISTGFLFFFLLFFQALKDHDYYTINLFILIPVVMLGFFLVLKEKFGNVYASLLFRILLLAFLIHNIDFARRRIADRYDPEGWPNKKYVENVRPFREMGPYLRTIGIKKEDRVLSLSDNSINITLYLMNQKGWTNYGVFSDSARISEKIRQGAKFLFISDKETYTEPGIQPFIKNKIGEFKNIEIYKL